jgi:hypothetical protein
MNYKSTIQDLFQTWNTIKTIEEWNQWSKKVLDTKFGTYGTIPFIEVIENVEFKFDSEYKKNTFINEIKLVQSI